MSLLTILRVLASLWSYLRGQKNKPVLGAVENICAGNVFLVQRYNGIEVTLSGVEAFSQTQWSKIRKRIGRQLWPSNVLCNKTSVY